VIYAGTSNFAGWRIASAAEAARRRNFLGPVSKQSAYNLMERTVELEVLPAAGFYGLLLPWSPALQAVCSPAPDANSTAVGTGARAHCPAMARERTKSSGRGPRWAVLALAWPLSRPGVTAPVIGRWTLGHLSGSLPAVEFEVADEISSQLDALFRGPAGPAPEAYTW
jgi:aryl-alcohol dehydrogenase-like predicted oxidoreductase